MIESPVTSSDQAIEKTSQRLSRSDLYGACLLVVLTVVAYAPALRAAFVWDDDLYITNNPVLRSLPGLFSAWVPGVTPQYYPLVFSTFWIEYHIWGLNPAAYHVVNVLIHLANAFLVWRLARNLRIPGAYAIALVFALHPMQTESVIWVTERKNVLSLFFYLLAADAFLRFDALRSSDPGETDTSRQRWIAYTVAMLAFVASLLSKSVTASLPVALLLMMMWRGGALSLGRLGPLVPMLIIGLGAGLHTAYLERLHVGATGPDFDFSLVERFLIAARAFLFYPTKLAVPWPLMFTYPRWKPDVADPYAWLALLVCIGVLGGMVIAWRRGARGVCLALLFYAVTIFPALGFSNFYPMRFSFVADHFVYHASLGLFALVVGGFTVWLKDRAAFRALLAVVLVAYLFLTFTQGSMYADQLTLWERTLALNPDAFMAHNNLAALLIGRGDFKASEYHSRESIRLKPDDYVAYANLAYALRVQGKIDEAIQQASHGIDELDRRIELHEAAAHDRIVNQLWTIKSELILQRAAMVRSRPVNSYGK